MDKLHWHPLLLGKLDSLYSNLGKWHSTPKFAKYLKLRLFFFINFFNQCELTKVKNKNGGKRVWMCNIPLKMGEKGEKKHEC